MTLAHLALAAGLLLAAPAAPRPAAGSPEKPAPAAKNEEVVDFDPELDPPRASEAELRLWKDGRQVTFDVRNTRFEASRLQRHVRSQELREKLGQAAERAEGERAAKLAALRQRLVSAWEESYGLFSRRWPVDPIRGCGYAWLAWDAALRVQADGSRNTDLAQARKSLETCVAGGRSAVEPMRRSNVAFAAVVAEAERALAAVAPGAPARGAEAREGTPEHERLEGEAPHREGSKHERHEHGAKRD